MPSIEIAAEPRVVVGGCDLSFALIGERLRQWREARRLTEMDFAEISGISRLQTASVEDGLKIPDVEALRVYARVLKIPVAILLYGDDAPLINGVWHGFSEFAEMFSRLSGGERNLLRVIAIRGRQRYMQPVLV